MDLYEGQNKEKALLDNMAELLAKEKQVLSLSRKLLNSLPPFSSLSHISN